MKRFLIPLMAIFMLASCSVNDNGDSSYNSSSNSAAVKTQSDNIINLLESKKSDMHITDIEDNDSWLSVTVDSEDQISSVYRYMINNGISVDEHGHGTDDLAGFEIDVHPPLQEIEAELVAKDEIRTIEQKSTTITKLLSKYRYELGINGISSGSKIIIRCDFEHNKDDVIKYLKECGVDISDIEFGEPIYDRTLT